MAMRNRFGVFTHTLKPVLKQFHNGLKPVHWNLLGFNVCTIITRITAAAVSAETGKGTRGDRYCLPDQAVAMITIEESELNGINTEIAGHTPWTAWPNVTACSAENSSRPSAIFHAIMCWCRNSSYQLATLSGLLTHDSGNRLRVSTKGQNEVSNVSMK